MGCSELCALGGVPSSSIMRVCALRACLKERPSEMLSVSLHIPTYVVLRIRVYTGTMSAAF